MIVEYRPRIKSECVGDRDDSANCRLPQAKLQEARVRAFDVRKLREMLLGDTDVGFSTPVRASGNGSGNCAVSGVGTYIRGHECRLYSGARGRRWIVSSLAESLSRHWTVAGQGYRQYLHWPGGPSRIRKALRAIRRNALGTRTIRIAAGVVGPGSEIDGTGPELQTTFTP